MASNQGKGVRTPSRSLASIYLICNSFRLSTPFQVTFVLTKLKSQLNTAELHWRLPVMINSKWTKPIDLKSSWRNFQRAKYGSSIVKSEDRSTRSLSSVQVPAYENDAGVRLFESNAIAFYCEFRLICLRENWSTMTIDELFQYPMNNFVAKHQPTKLKFFNGLNTVNEKLFPHPQR